MARIFEVGHGFRVAIEPDPVKWATMTQYREQAMPIFLRELSRRMAACMAEIIRKYALAMIRPGKFEGFTGALFGSIRSGPLMQGSLPGGQPFWRYVAGFPPPHRGPRSDTSFVRALRNYLHCIIFGTRPSAFVRGAPGTATRDRMETWLRLKFDLPPESTKGPGRRTRAAIFGLGRKWARAGTPAHDFWTPAVYGRGRKELLARIEELRVEAFIAIREIIAPFRIKKGVGEWVPGED